MSYRSKRTRAQMTMKEVEVQKMKKLNTLATASSSQIASDGGDERWGPFRPPNDGAPYLATDKHLNTSALDGSSIKSCELHQIKNGERPVTPLSPHKKTHITSPIQATSSSKIPVPQPQKFQSKTTTFSPSNATEQVPAATKTNPIWRSSVRPSVAQTTTSQTNNLKSKSSLPFATNRVHTANVSTPTSSGPTPPVLTTTQSASTQAKHAATSSQTNKLKSKSSLPFATNRAHTANFSAPTLSGPTTPVLPTTEAASTQATHAATSSQTNKLKSKSSFLFATDRPHIANFSSATSSGPTTPVLTATQAASRQGTQAVISAISPETNFLISKSSLPFATNRLHTVKLKSKLVNSKSDTLDTPLAPPDEDLVDNVNVKPFKPRRHKVVVPDWPDEVAFDEKDEVMTVDKEGNYKTVNNAIQPHDVWHDDSTKYFVTFNEFHQPLKMGGHILIRFIGHVAKTEQICPINELDWRHVSPQLKVDILKLIRDRFVIPDGELFDRAILKRTGNSVRQYRHHLKKLFFKPTTKTKEQIYEVVPSGHPRPSWIRLVDYWYSDKGKRLSECGKEARANQNHMHTTGPTSYANIRADFEEKNKREPSVLEIFKQTHRKKDGTFVKDTVTEDFLIDVDASIDMETVMQPSNSKSRVQLENEAFNKVMYGKDTPTRPVGYGYGVKQSDVFGVHSIFRKEGFGCGASTSLALENMKKAVADVTKENKELKTKCNESNGLLKKMTTQFAQILDLFSTGQATTEVIDMAKSVLNINLGSTEVLDSSDGDDAPSYVD